MTSQPDESRPAERQARATAAQEASRSLAAARAELQRWEQQDATTRKEHEDRWAAVAGP